jgi:hypothetical protein
VRPDRRSTATEVRRDMQLGAATWFARNALLVLAICTRVLVLVAALWAADECWTGGLGVALFDAIAASVSSVPAGEGPRDGRSVFIDGPWGDDADVADGEQAWRTDDSQPWRGRKLEPVSRHWRLQ